MIHAAGVSFGNGMREIFPERKDHQPQLDVIQVRPRKRKRERKDKKKLTVREMVILVSCFGPVIFGMTFATVMLRHEVFYIAYWMTCWIWCGFVLFANTTRKGKEKRC